MHLARAEIVSNVWKIEAREGDQVGPGDVLAVLESMKMEIPLVATVNGHVSRILVELGQICLLYTSPSPRDGLLSRMPSSA